MDKNKEDFYFMQRTFRLAEKAKAKTSPNPLVGAVIVKKGKIIAEGFHKACGLPHAESEALKKAGLKAQGATLYVNLEPCFHFGRTSPCVDEIIKAGIKRVVIALKDPNPMVFGKSIKKLKRNSIHVSLGVCRKQAEKINEIFLKNMKKKLPFVAAKVAASLDGKITTASGQSKWITKKPARDYARRLRDSYDAVLIGASTLRKDNPQLNGVKNIPYKIVISSSLNLAKNSYIFKDFPDRLILFSSLKSAGKNKIPQGAKAFFLKETGKGLPLKIILKKLYSLGVMSVFVEGGSYTLGRFFEERLIDKIYFFIAPKIIGGKNSLPSVGASGFKQLSQSLEVKDIEVKSIGKDLLIQGYPKP